MLKNEEHQKVEKLIHLIGKIGAKFPQLSESTVDALIHIVDDHMEPESVDQQYKKWEKLVMLEKVLAIKSLMKLIRSRMK